MRKLFALLSAAAFVAACGGSTSSTSSAAGSATTTTRAAVAASGATATLTFKGQTYTFTTGRCSTKLDPDQFLFRDPPNPGLDPTYFALTVTDVKPGSETAGGTYKGALTYQKDRQVVVNVSGDLQLVIAADLKSGSFSGPDYFTKEIVTGSYTC
jgi:hypothetical protein